VIHNYPINISKDDINRVLNINSSDGTCIIYSYDQLGNRCPKVVNSENNTNIKVYILNSFSKRSANMDVGEEIKVSTDYQNLRSNATTGMY
jgi:hypothetical protein